MTTFCLVLFMFYSTKIEGFYRLYKYNSRKNMFFNIFIDINQVKGGFV